jgi:hypothetical protein
VSKTATASFTRTYTWGISKSVDKPEIDIASGGTATFNYKVDVTHDSGTESNWQVTGTITVSNPNSFDVTLTGVTDTVDNGGSCTVYFSTPGDLATYLAANPIPKSSSTTFQYTCTYGISGPNPASGTNTATATWDKATYNTPSGTASGTKTFDFSGVTPTIVDGSVTVTDTLGGSLGTVSYTDSSPTEFKYSYDFTGDAAGTCTTHGNTATFTSTTSATTGDSNTVTVKVCVGEDLEVSKDASSTFTRTFTWGISKDVDKTEIDIAQGGTATFTYTIKVTHDAGADSDWQVDGKITVKNPNDWEAITADVTDAVDNGGTCTVSTGTLGDDPSSFSLAAGASEDFTYKCTYASPPNPTSGTNTATAKWDATTYFTPTGTASGTAPVDFSTPTTIVDGSVTVFDTLLGSLNTPGAGSYTDPSPTTFTFIHPFAGDPAGTCTSHDNTVTFTTSTTRTTGSASQTVKVCVGADLTVSKTATPSSTWTIEKSPDKSTVNIAAGDTATFTYTITVTNTGNTVSGTITVTNPNDWEGITADVADAVDNGGTCIVTGGTGVSIPAGESVKLDYQCDYSSAPTSASGKNTATATWEAATYFTPDGSADGSASFSFSPVVVSDTRPDGTVVSELGECSVTASQPCTFTDSFTTSGVVGQCTDYTNTATIKETGQTASATVKVCVVPPASVTSSSFCSLPSDQFRLIYIQDSNTAFTLKASNPGQFYYNVFYISGSDTAAGTTFTATIPYPFITQGAVPIQVFENQPLPTCGTTAPSTNINKQFTISPTIISLGNGYSSLGQTVTVTFTLNTAVPAGNLLWFAFHLDYGLKGLDFNKVPVSTASCLSPNTGDCALIGTVLVGNLQDYAFTNDLPLSTSNTISSTNSFKKDPGFAGVVTSSGTGNPIRGVTIKIYVNNKLIATVTSDQDGFYSYSYKYTGSKTSYTVTATYGSVTQTVTGTLQSNALIIQSFTF